MQLRGKRNLLDMKQFRNLLVRLLLEHVQVEHGAASSATNDSQRLGL